MKAELFINNDKTIYSFDLLSMEGYQESGILELRIKNQSDDLTPISFLEIHAIEFLIGWGDGDSRPSKKPRLHMRAPKTRSFLRFSGDVARVDHLKGDEYRVNIKNVYKPSLLEKK